MMANQSDDSHLVRIFCGDHFDHWYIKMKIIFISQYLLKYVKDGYDESQPTTNPDN